jgi:predicted nucleic acid-binding protein
MDLKIASDVISQTTVLIFRNLKDFEQAPNLVVKDWTQ